MTESNRLNVDVPTGLPVQSPKRAREDSSTPGDCTPPPEKIKVWVKIPIRPPIVKKRDVQETSAPPPVSDVADITLKGNEISPKRAPPPSGRKTTRRTAPGSKSVPTAPSPAAEKKNMMDGAEDLAARFAPRIAEQLAKGRPQLSEVAEHIAFLIAKVIIARFADRAGEQALLLVGNLGDLGNDSLRKKILFGEIPPEKVAVLSDTDLMNPDTIQRIQRIKKEVYQDSDLNELEKAQSLVSDIYKCENCGKPCSFKQLQIRGGDESMTTFIRCHNCGEQSRHD